MVSDGKGSSVEYLDRLVMFESVSFYLCGAETGSIIIHACMLVHKIMSQDRFQSPMIA